MEKKRKEPLELATQIKWIMLSRIVFALVLIVGCLVFSIGEKLSFFLQPFLYLYNIAALLLILSIFYLVWFNKLNHHILLAYVQIIMDTFGVMLIIYVTGGFSSVFTFLYLVVIIYTSMLLLLKGSIIIATLASLQYGVLVELEYYGIITPYLGEPYLSSSIDESHIIYRIIIFLIACFAVSVLSGILAAQLKGARQDLKITQQHLKRVEKMAAMDELISGIAHEVKNPLASLSGSIQLLREDTDPGSYEDKLMQIILRETERLKNIVNNIGLFAKPNINNAKKTNLIEAIEETVALFVNDPEWGERIHVQMHLKKNISVFIDPEHFSQILWNLLKNAAQSIKGQGEIIIELTSARKNRVYLSIEDNGSGIDKSQKNHIFDPFFTTKAEGTGLGLSIIHRIIDTYNGMIDFESSPGKGTIFTILLKETP